MIPRNHSFRTRISTAQPSTAPYRANRPRLTVILSALAIGWQLQSTGIGSSAYAQDSNSNSPTTGTMPSFIPGSTPGPSDARIIPAAPDSIGGGNPFQGLGRPDESAPSRRSQFESTPIPGSVNPNVPPDLPPPPSTDPIDLLREKEEKERELEAQKKAEEKEKRNAQRTTNAAIDTPLKKALLELHLHNYDKSLSHLDDIIATNPRNAEAHYLKAVIYVLTRKYDAAAAEYRRVLASDPSPTLSMKARAGLVKLAH